MYARYLNKWRVAFAQKINVKVKRKMYCFCFITKSTLNEIYLANVYHHKTMEEFYTAFLSTVKSKKVQEHILAIYVVSSSFHLNFWHSNIHIKLQTKTN